MKSLKQTKILFGFGLSMMDKEIEMQNANKRRKADGTRDNCPCEDCVLRRKFENRGFND